MSRKALRPQWKLGTCKIREEGGLCTKKFRPLLSSEKFSAVWHWNLEKQVSMKNHRPHGWNQPEVLLVFTHSCWHNTFETSLTLSTWQVLKTQMLLLKVTPDSLVRIFRPWWSLDARNSTWAGSRYSWYLHGTVMVFTGKKVPLLGIVTSNHAESKL